MFICYLDIFWLSSLPPLHLDLFFSLSLPSLCCWADSTASNFSAVWGPVQEGSPGWPVLNVLDCSYSFGSSWVEPLSSSCFRYHFILSLPAPLPSEHHMSMYSDPPLLLHFSQVCSQIESYAGLLEGWIFVLTYLYFGICSLIVHVYVLSCYFFFFTWGFRDIQNICLHHCHSWVSTGMSTYIQWSLFDFCFSFFFFKNHLYRDIEIGI